MLWLKAPDTLPKEKSECEGHRSFRQCRQAFIVPHGTEKEAQKHPVQEELQNTFDKIIIIIPHKATPILF
jgi:hypothetical protein